MLAARSASTTKETTSVNAMKVTRWTLSLRPAKPWVSHLHTHTHTHMRTHTHALLLIHVVLMVIDVSP